MVEVCGYDSPQHSFQEWLLVAALPLLAAQVFCPTPLLLLLPLSPVCILQAAHLLFSR